MSKLHASESGGHTSVPAEDVGETLTDAQQTTLRQGLGYAPLPCPHADFNAAVLATLQSGQDFGSVAEQAQARLRWAAPPAVIGFALMYGLACWQAHSLPRLPSPYPGVNHAQPAPPLPDLPILSQLGKSASAKSAFPKSPSPSDAGAARRGVGVRSRSAAASTSKNAAAGREEPRHDR